MTGHDLATLLAREPRRAAGAAVRLALQITRALSAAHGAGVVHGWLRPASIFVPAPSSIKLFGFATVRLYGWDGRGDPSGSRFPPGVIEYLPPEQLRGAPPDPRTDLYGVGALLYELLTGVPAHTGKRELLERKKQSPPQSPRLFRPDLPPEVEQLLVQLLDPDPQRRPGSAEELEASPGLADPSDRRAGGRGASADRGAAPSPAPGVCLPGDRRAGGGRRKWRGPDRASAGPARLPEADAQGGRPVGGAGLRGRSCPVCRCARAASHRPRRSRRSRRRRRAPCAQSADPDPHPFPSD